MEGDCKLAKTSCVLGFNYCRVVIFVPEKLEIFHLSLCKSTQPETKTVTSLVNFTINLKTGVKNTWALIAKYCQ